MVRACVCPDRYQPVPVPSSCAQQTRTRVETDRRYQIEACIVRVMKARQTLNHNDLVVEVISQLSARFKPVDTHYIQINKSKRRNIWIPHAQGCDLS